jgi:hypothetical protein
MDTILEISNLMLHIVYYADFIDIWALLTSCRAAFKYINDAEFWLTVAKWRMPGRNVQMIYAKYTEIGRCAAVRYFEMISIFDALEFDALERGSHHFMSDRIFNDPDIKSTVVRNTFMSETCLKLNNSLKSLHMCIDRVVATYENIYREHLSIFELIKCINTNSSILEAIDIYNNLYCKYASLDDDFKKYPWDKSNYNMPIKDQDFMAAIIKTRNENLIRQALGIINNNYHNCKYLLKYMPNIASDEHFMRIWMDNIECIYVSYSCAQYISKHTNIDLFTKICIWFQKNNGYLHELLLILCERFMYDKIDIVMTIFKSYFTGDSCVYTVRNILDINNATLVRRIFNKLDIFDAKSAAKLAGLNVGSIDSCNPQKSARIKLLIRAFALSK